MDLYHFSLATLTVANVGLGYLQYSARKERQDDKEEEASSLLEKHQAAEQDVYEFQKSFFLVYVFVVAADWLQGPYMYALYKDEKGLPEKWVASLFASGFVAAAVSASFVGAYADHYGRKMACLWFCCAYSASCLTTIFDNPFILFVGRILGGVSTTLMYSVFETWMVHEYHVRSMSDKGLQLGRIFGLMTTCSSVVAILSGVTGQYLVDITGTQKAPFLAALVCLATAFWLITHTWPENYGNKIQARGSVSGIRQDIQTILQDTKIVGLGSICCLFEGTMYLFVFFWSAALKSSRAAAGHTSSPPFGLVFATFMSAMMLGSQLFTVFGNAATVASSVQSLSFNILLAGASLLGIVLFRDEALTLWSFCIFEACVGMYYPSMGYLKGQIVQDNVRGKVYGLMRLPLNTFVVITLGLTKEGDRHRDNVFLTCSGLLILAYVISQKYLA